MKAKLLYFDTDESIADMKEAYNNYKLGGFQNKVTIFLLGLLLLSVYVIVFGFDWDYHEPMYVGVIVFVVVCSVITLGLIINCVGTFEFYAKYKSFESYASAEYNLQYISLLGKEAPISSKLYRVGDHFNLRYTYITSNGVVHKAKTDIRLNIKYHSGIDDVWCDVDKQVLYIPYKLKGRVLTRGYLDLDTVFTKNRLLRNV